jgi:hypothetical protein
VFTAERTWNSHDLIGFLGALPWSKAPRVVVLDNAGLHTSRVVRAARSGLALRGVHLYFLPPYSPELNQIEKDQADCTSSDRWCDPTGVGYDRRRRAARAGRVVPTTFGRDTRRIPMPAAARPIAPPRP